MPQKKIKIAILEDDRFYNEFLTRQIEIYFQNLTFEGLIGVKIRSYTTVDRFLGDLDADTDILFTDYYLDKGINAKSIVQRVSDFCDHCTVVILSQNKKSYVVQDTMQMGATQFIHKDIHSLDAVCTFLDGYFK